MNDKFKCDSCGDTGYIFRDNLYGKHISKCPDCKGHRPTMTDDDSPNVACYRLGYDVGFNIGAETQLTIIKKLVSDWAYVSGLTDKELLLSAISAAAIKK